MTPASPLITIEWGTARLLARLLDGSGRIVETRKVDRPLAALGQAEIAAALEVIVDSWPTAEAPILLSGMIGSAMGWREVARVACPADSDQIARNIVADRIGDRPVLFVPGLSCRSRFGDPDVLRGEEVVAIGVLETLADASATLLSVPGMHGKWLSLADRAITDFTTSMTVDLHRLLAQHSILAPLMQAAPEDEDAFADGVARVGDGGGIARLLFAARSRNLLEGMGETAASSYLWGVLIGSDIREHLGQTGPVQISGAPAVVPLFAAAIRQLGGRATAIDTDAAAAAGFLALARRSADLREAAA